MYALMLTLDPANNQKSIIIFKIQLALLTIANILNIWNIISPGADSVFHTVMDMFWPLSNLFMLVTGIAWLCSGATKNWRRYVVLVVGLWLPFSILFVMLLGRKSLTLTFGSVYSIIAWSLMGYVVFKLPAKVPASYVGPVDIVLINDEA